MYCEKHIQPTAFFLHQLASNPISLKENLMSIENKPKQPSHLEMAALGFLRGAAPFPLEHVLERMKLAAQTRTDLSATEAVKRLWQSQGIRGLYAGSRANFLRRTLRETYHWPAMLSLNHLWKGVIPEHWNRDHLITNVATGYSMAFVQASVILPFERLLIEKTSKGGYLPLLKRAIHSRGILYEGFQATWLRHSYVWNLFFVSSHTSQKVVQRWDPAQVHPYLSYVVRSMITSSLVVGLGYPMEFLRNRILMEPEILAKGTLRGVHILFHRYKWKNLYSGAPVMALHNLLQTMILQKLIDKINLK